MQINQNLGFKVGVISLLTLGVVACGGGGDSSDNSAIKNTVLDSPKITQSAIDDKGITLSWSSVEGAESYNIYYSTDAALNIKNYAVYDNSNWLKKVNSPYLLSDLKPENLYYFVVTAVKGSYESEGSTVYPVITRYKIIGKSQDIIKDVVTNLEWQRCSLGQLWSVSTKRCTGTANRYNTPSALKYKIPNTDGWRLPTVNEIKSLVYCSAKKPIFFVSQDESCQDPFNSSDKPTIVQYIFPDTPFDVTYNTSTAIANIPIGYTGNYDLIFKDGSIGASYDNNGGISKYQYIRLVRSVAP